jgi:hypothetical protein
MGRGWSRAGIPIVCTLALALCLPAACVAGSPGKWSQISPDTTSSRTVPSLDRDAAGRLHVAWGCDFGASMDSRAISPGGVPGARKGLAWNWLSIHDPAVVYDRSSGQTLLFAGGTPVPNPYPSPGLQYWYSLEDGVSFALANALAAEGDLVDGAGVRAAWTPAAVFQTWTPTAAGVFVHRGLIAGENQRVIPDGSWSNLVYDDARDRLLVLAARAGDHAGLWMRRIDQDTGAAAGPLTRLAGSASLRAGELRFRAQQTPVPATALSGRAGVVVAYPTGSPRTDAVRVWRITAAGVTSSVVASGGAAKHDVAVAADPKGRVWVVWAETGATRVYARRSNVGATSWGRTQWLKTPKRTEPRRIAASAQSSRLDLVALFNRGETDNLYHTQVLP